MKINLQVITPEKVVLSEDVDQVSIPTTRGEITVLPHHVNLVTPVAEGELIIKNNSRTEYFAVAGGFLEIAHNIATVLADYAVHSDEINMEKALEAQKRAEEMLKKAKENASDRDLALAETQMRRAILQLKVSGRRKERRNITS